MQTQDKSKTEVLPNMFDLFDALVGTKERGSTVQASMLRMTLTGLIANVDQHVAAALDKLGPADQAIKQELDAARALLIPDEHRNGASEFKPPRVRELFRPAKFD